MVDEKKETKTNNTSGKDSSNSMKSEVSEMLSFLESQVMSLEKEVESQSEDEYNISDDTIFNSSEFIRIGDGKGDSTRGFDFREINLNERQPKSFKWSNTLITKRLFADDDFKALSEDTFTMMIMSKPGTKQWWYAFVIFAVQITLLTMILQDQYTYEYTTTPFDVPYKVSSVVHAGQLLAILLSIATQTDLVIAIITFIMLWSRHRISWTQVTEVAENSHTKIWTLRVALPLCCKFLEGVLVLLTTFVIVIQSDSIIELFKDFAAMQLISELDNMMFWLALHGYAGLELMDGARKAQKVRIKDNVSKSFCGIPLRTLILITIFMVMVSGWVYFVIGQVSGAFFYMKFPHCNITETLIPRMGNGFCDGGDLNTIGCNFDDGDCLAFNIAYPGCRIVETNLIGDGHCDPLFNTIECGFDGGDCCPVAGDPRLGNGICNGFVFNTEACGWDDGDCLEFNKNYPDCISHEEYAITELYVETQHLGDFNFGLGDNICQGLSLYMTEACGYEFGECRECFKEFGHIDNIFDNFADGYCNGNSILNVKQCSFDGGDCFTCMKANENNPAFNASLLGDDYCDGGAYMSDECYRDNGDCDWFFDSFPDCQTEFPETLSDNVCNKENDTPECNYDDGACESSREQFNLIDCDVEDMSRIGDGICDGGKYVSEGCAFDGGDCDGCPGNIRYIGDGICDGKVYMNEECGWDSGDCDNCQARDIMKVGDGTCDEFLNNIDCYYDGGDCIGVSINEEGETVPFEDRG